MASQREFNWPVNQLSVSAGPLEYLKNGVTTTVAVDTTTPSNTNTSCIRCGKAYLDSIRLDYSITNVTTGAWYNLPLLLEQRQCLVLLYLMVVVTRWSLGIGAAAAETRALLIPQVVSMV